MSHKYFPDFGIIEEIPTHHYIDNDTLHSYRYRQVWYNGTFALHIATFAKTVEEADELMLNDGIDTKRDNTTLKIENDSAFNANLNIFWKFDNPTQDYIFDKLTLYIPSFLSDDPEKIDAYEEFILNAIDAQREFTDILKHLFPDPSHT